MKNWQDMSKEQKQLVVMSLILGFIVIFLAFQFGLSPFLASRARMTAEYEKLKTELDQAAQSIKGETQIKESLEDKAKMLEQAYRDYIPASENPLAWATKKIYGEGRGVGVDIESVAEIATDSSLWTGKDQTKRCFKPYSVRIVTQCSYAQLVRLVRVLEADNPHMFISNISVLSEGGSVERHTVNLVVEWPSWKAPDHIPDLSGKEKPAAPAAAKSTPSA